MNEPVIKLRKKSTPINSWDGVNKILQSIYLSRGLTDKEQLNYGLDKLPSPALMKSNLRAGKLLSKAIKDQQRLLILADFDVDGATSCTLMVLALRAMGAKHVDYLVPDRFKFGYGLTPEIVDVAAELSPDIIITVDNGIASNDGVARANELGIKVLITDHHLPAKTLPDAIAIVNPNQPDCEFPSKSLAGVGVAFYVMLALRQQLREQNWFNEQNRLEPNLAEFLDLVALGTVADIVPLELCNRILVSHGMKRIKAGKCRPGIRALLTIAKKDIKRLQANDLGFAVAPRLNAAGRLDDMSLGIECLLTDDESRAFQLGAELDKLNLERREIESTMQQQALDSLQKLSLDGIKNSALCLYKKQWHQGIIGLLASRIKDKIYRPVIIFADADADEDADIDDSDKLLKGSGRSVPGLHIRDILDQVATENPHLLNKFGGHAMAAGMTIRKSDLESFEIAFYKVVDFVMGGKIIDNIAWSDGELPHLDMTLDLARSISEAGPWGQAFEEPRFHGKFQVISQRTLSGKHIKLQLENNSGKVFDAIAFFQSDELLSTQLRDVELLYKLDVNFFRNNENLQLLIDVIYPL